MALSGLFARAGVHRAEHVSVARDFSVYTAVNIASLVLLLGTGLVLRRYLGLYLAGIWTALEVLPAYAAYAHLGTLNAAERELPFLIGAGRTEDFDKLKHTLLWLSHGLGALLAAGLVIAALALQARVERPFFVGLLVYAPLLWAQILATYYLLLFRARQRFVELSTRQAIANLLKALLTIGLGYAFGLYGVFAALLLATTVQLVLFHTALHETFERRFDAGILRPLLVDGVPMLVGAVAFETMRNTDRIVIGAALGFEALGVYSITQIVCQGVYYVPNALSTVMYPRFQERYGRTQSAQSLQKFVEVQLHVLADVLLAGTIVLLVALPPAIRAFFPAFEGTIAPLRVMLVGTYFLCLAPPAGQLLLTIHKQVPALLIAVPAMLLALAGAYVGSRAGLVGVAIGVSLACFVEFLALNTYAFSHFAGGLSIARRLLSLAGTAALWIAAALVVERYVPAGPGPIAVVGGWRVLVAALLGVPLLVRSARRIRALQVPQSVDITGSGD
jgi:O-antigen/teichoic acid export membrane protein